jgi:hypothetical protein
MRSIVDGINFAIASGARKARLESLESSTLDALIAAVREDALRRVREGVEGMTYTLIGFKEAVLALLDREAPDA